MRRRILGHWQAVQDDAIGRRIGADPGIMIRGRQIGGISQVRRGGDVLVAFLQILQQRWVGLEFVIAGAELVAAAAIELVDHLQSFDLSEPFLRRIVDDVLRNRLGHKTENEGHHRFARIRLLFFR